MPTIKYIQPCSCINGEKAVPAYIVISEAPTGHVQVATEDDEDGG